MPSLAGVYKARVTNTSDPTGSGRVQVTIAALGGAGSVWAPVAKPFTPVPVSPKVGSSVWVAFEGGDSSFPVVIGGAVG